MNQLIIVTGLSGTGKSSLLQRIQDNYICTCLSVDEWKDKHYDRGFHNKNEKRKLEEDAYQEFKTNLELLMSDSKDIIIEYPFSVDRWEAYFDRIINAYNYDTCLINCFGNGDFESIWDNIIKRETPEYRHPAHNLSKYVPGEQIDNHYFYLTDKESLRKKYMDHTYTTLSLNCLSIDYYYGEYEKVFTLLDTILSKQEEK